jgi:hypothetical protein
MVLVEGDPPGIVTRAHVLPQAHAHTEHSSDVPKCANSKLSSCVWGSEVRPTRSGNNMQVMQHGKSFAHATQIADYAAHSLPPVSYAAASTT